MKKIILLVALLAATGTMTNTRIKKMENALCKTTKYKEWLNIINK